METIRMITFSGFLGTYIGAGMWQFRKIVGHLDDSMQKSLSNSSHQLIAVGALAFLGFPLFYFIWAYWFPQPYESLILRGVGSALGLGLMLAPYWPNTWKKYLSWYWFLSLVYTLPFFFMFLFLMNQAGVVAGMSLLCSVFLLVLLVDLLSMAIVFALGLFLAVLAYYWISPQIYLGQEHLEMTLIILFTVISGSTVNYKTAMLQQQRLGGIAAAAGMVAHELRTPLLGIKSGAQALVNYLPALIEGYNLAKAHNLINTPLREGRMQQLEKVSDRIVSETDYANLIIDMLLMKAGRENSLKNCTLERCSMADCLAEAIGRYPFQSTRDRHRVTFGGDFEFRGSKLLMEHILFNLLKNALYAVATAQKGEISVWVESSEKFNYLYFKDTAKGMSAQQVSRLFNHFYTTKFMGTGIGLPFCKLVMTEFGGTISCEAREGDYTLFTMGFPVVESLVI